MRLHIIEKNKKSLLDIVFVDNHILKKLLVINELKA